MNEIIILNIAFFIIGSCFGSFLSVLIYRTIHSKKGIVKGRSACPHCRHRLKAIHLVPLLSYIFQGGRCTFCHKPISPTYPILELLTGLLFLTNFNFLVNQYDQVSWLVFSVDSIFWLKLLLFNLLSLNLLAICFADLQKKSIPENFLYVWIALSLFSLVFTATDILAMITDHGLAILLALTFFGGQYLVSKGRWLGSGDIYFSLGMAVLLGLSNFILALICAYFIGSLIIIILMLSKQVKAKQTIPFTPFLVMGTLIAFYYGSDIIYWYFNTFLNINFF